MAIDHEALLADAKKQVDALEDDLRERSAEPEFHDRLRAEYDEAMQAKRTAATYETWRDERVTQAAVAWVLGCVFVRFSEDNGLIPEPFLAGPGDALAVAEARHEAFFREYPECNDRDWLEAAFTHLADAHPTAAGLFDRAHNPLWDLTPSYEAASALLRFWRKRDSDNEIVHDFTDPEWNTRFLGDLYQDLSEAARKTYALLQTPEFVEEFILDLTLEPAVEEFGLEPTVEIHRQGGGVERALHGLRTIDPACGSGHFLLGIFHRLLDKWRKTAPGVDDWDLIRRSLRSVHGCDKNPFAASIARFRLLVAAMQAGGAERLSSTPEFPINVAVGDSLMHGRDVKGEQGDLLAMAEEFTYRTEDVNEYVNKVELLTPSSYHVVVGNPPYITVKDKQENKNYRERWSACAGTYALSVPFAQRLFHLATRDQEGGFVGQITANSFMKREFGRKVIEQFFPTVALTYVIDSSGAYIPGHGTPTVILVGRKTYPNPNEAIRTVLGVRGEPTVPNDPTTGFVWTAIVDQIDRPGSDSEWVSSQDIPRQSFSTHPWSLSGGGASDLLVTLDSPASRLSERMDSSGRTTHTGLDDAFYLPRTSTNTRNVSTGCVPVILGEHVRDFTIEAPIRTLFPYDPQGNRRDLGNSEHRFAWPNRTSLRERIDFGNKPEERGLWWFEHSMFFPNRFRSPMSISFGFVATHNHFVLDRGGKVFKQSAPVIKLPTDAGEDDHLALLGILNSSTACFWLKQVSHNKGNEGYQSGIKTEMWERFFEFTGTKLQDFPLPAELPLSFGQGLDSQAQELAACEPSAIAEESTPTRDRLEAARAEHTRIRGRMIAQQEELDWEVYRLYGLLTEAEAAELRAKDEDVPELKLGERAFEIVLARKMAAGEVETAWFERHGSTPITEIPEHWPAGYKRVVEKRIETIENRRDIALIERPECKRRWASEPWEKKEREALETWLLDRCEDKNLWYAPIDGIKQPRTLTVNQLADLLRGDEDLNQVAQLYAADHLGNRDLPLADVLERIIADEHVPYLAAMRYKDTGLRKRAQWEDVWEQQREEDRTGKRLDIPVPPKYKSADFRKTSYWSHRGKLDVPKERFISYPEASPDADPTLLLGWAGWDHLDQAQALVNLVNDRTEQAGRDTAKITPLLAGLAELMPWVHQWHGDYDPEWGGNPAEELRTYLHQQQVTHQLTDDNLKDWRPEQRRKRGAARG
ncbi:type I restriction-modification system DNA methylase subunit [Amycolatopsis cihanbeyliensis]|uniref:site-specific DNA-methyltransferase (adenine-specific) n=1 Tax=Amycolatopsis cihanbeyliensis TaxID=1128664 RepID=A0A542DLW9_AMYCI|nr:type I restriction-modification system DNA methylase subunit [Amycolatopsis cihanbeyliensis]